MKLGINIGLLILRITTGGLMLFHGILKITSGVSFIRNTLVESSWPGWFAYGVYIGEIVAPILIILGWRTRIAAFVFAFNMIFATFLVHSDDIFKLGSHGAWAIELQAFYIFAAVALIFTGGGKFSISRSSFGD